MLTIIGIILAVVVIVVAVGLVLRSRAGRARPDIFTKRPHRRGRVGRIR